MAYLDLRSAFDVTAPAMPVRLDDTEWRVVMLAEKEGLASVSEPGWGARLLAWVTGVAADHRLANPRLEALRRFSVLAWHYSYALPVSAISGLRAAGFSEAQLEYVLASIARFRDRRSSARA